MHIQPYLFFDGRCDQAIEFYRQALGAEVVMLMRFGESPEGEAQCAGGVTPPADKVMHACLQIGQTQVMMSDGFCSGKPEFKGVSLSLTVADDTQARQAFDALAEGGEVQQPLSATFFASSFGMVADRFGVSWMVVTASAGAT
ncbi:VOC family protein [Pseudoxanthomonas wuyuanensis]|uniref:PhnB protein n=1 Tax=Pseudoxanthomonas wuyuanensis TaxID=1073196 RepID=A0A286D7B4_9GAMM|nr:VOC family protein [Pseudoxanthomonas wuyuanensis]KAF1721050.1 VOC family protein [Pseudoxanthomonas wuyuanensis]SOD54520.1 PhnB protein [Pseudoxanthomonas wuyuanensis]